MNIIERRAQVGNTESFEVDVSNWLDDESLGTAVVTSDLLSSVDSSLIDGDSVKFLLAGVSTGISRINIRVTTATRQRDFEILIKVTD